MAQSHNSPRRTAGRARPISPTVRDRLRPHCGGVGGELRPVTHSAGGGLGLVKMTLHCANNTPNTAGIPDTAESDIAGRATGANRISTAKDHLTYQGEASNIPHHGTCDYNRSQVLCPVLIAPVSAVPICLPPSERVRAVPRKTASRHVWRRLEPLAMTQRTFREAST